MKSRKGHRGNLRGRKGHRGSWETVRGGEIFQEVVQRATSCRRALRSCRKLHRAPLPGAGSVWCSSAPVLAGAAGMLLMAGLETHFLGKKSFIFQFLVIKNSEITE